MRPRTISLSALPERDHPIAIDNRDEIEFSDWHWTDGPFFQDGPYDDWDSPRWTWLAESQDERRRQRVAMETTLKLSQYGCRLVRNTEERSNLDTFAFNLMDNPR